MRTKYLGVLVAVMLVAGAVGPPASRARARYRVPGRHSSRRRVRPAAGPDRALCRAGHDGHIPRSRSRR